MEENKKQGFSSHTEDLPEEMLFSEDYDEDNVLYDTNARIYETDESDAVYDEENAEDDILYDADARYYEEFEENDEENGEEGGEEAIEDSGDDGTDSTMGSGFQADGPQESSLPGNRPQGNSPRETAPGKTDFRQTISRQMDFLETASGETAFRERNWKILWRRCAKSPAESAGLPRSLLMRKSFGAIKGADISAL